MQRNLRVVTINGQAFLIENVTEYSIDSLGLHITWVDETQEKVGDKVEKVSTTKKDWFNTMGIMAVKEEYKK